MPSKLELIIEDDSTTLVVNIEDNPRLSDTIPLSTTIDNQLTRNLDGYYVPPTSWEDLRDRPNSTTEEIDDAVSRSEQNASSIEGLEQSKVDKVVGKELSSNDFTDTLKGKLEELENFDDSVIQAELSNKVDKVAGKQLSTEDFTTAEKSELAALQDQLHSAFSPISWHDQIIPNSVVIPPGKNAWSFGPTMTIETGQSVVVSVGSYWTIS